MQRRWFWLPLALGTLMTMLFWGCDGDDDDFAGDDDAGDDDGGDDDADDDDDDDADDDGGDDDGGDDDTGDDDGGDDDTMQAAFHVSGSMVPSPQDPPPIAAGVELFVALYKDVDWDPSKDWPLNQAINAHVGSTSVKAPGSWPVVFDVPAYEAGSLHLWVLADQDGDGAIGEGDAWGIAVGNPLNVNADITGAQIIIDGYWPENPGDDDTTGDDDTGDDDDITVPPG